MTDTLFPLPSESPKPTVPGKGKPRLEQANRHQVEMRVASLDELVPDDHRVRLVWALVQDYDLSAFYDAIDAVEGEAGRPAIDPRLLLAVWLYATLEGVGSARAVDRLCREHVAYQWLLGGVSVNYHTLADFRVQQEAKLDTLLTRSVAVLLQEGLVDLEQTAQDGVRIRASAGASSFRRAETLEPSVCSRPSSPVQELKAARDAAGEAPVTKRQQAARERQAHDRMARVKQALQEVEKLEAKKAKQRELKRKKRPVRASTTDPDARVTKMPDGGFRPAYSGQLNVDMQSRIIVGVEVSTEADAQLLGPMLKQTQDRYERLMTEHYVDGGFRSNDGITAAGQQGVAIYSPIPAGPRWSAAAGGDAADGQPASGRMEATDEHRRGQGEIQRAGRHGGMGQCLAAQPWLATALGPRPAQGARCPVVVCVGSQPRPDSQSAAAKGVDPGLRVEQLARWSAAGTRRPPKSFHRWLRLARDNRWRLQWSPSCASQTPF